MVGVGDTDQLHFAKLMLPQHTPRVPSGRPGFTAKAVGQGGQPDRQVLLRHDVTGDGVGQGHFGGGDQVAAVGGLEQVFLELRQTAGAVDRGGIDQRRDDRLL